MELAQFSSHLETNVKNIFILDLVLKDEKLAYDAFNTFTESYQFKDVVSLVDSFYHQYQLEDEDNKLAIHTGLQKFRYSIDDLLLKRVEKELKDGYIHDMIDYFSTNFYNFHEDTFSQLVEFTDEIEEYKKVQWLNAIFSHTGNLVIVSPTIHSQRAKEILNIYIDRLEINSARNLITNTDMLNWHTLEQDFIKNNETTNIFQGHYYHVNKKISLRLASLCDLLENHISFDSRHKILREIVNSSNDKDKKVLIKALEDNSMQFAVSKEHFDNIEVIEQYLLFNRAKQFANSVESFYELLTIAEKTPEILTFSLSGSKINLNELNILESSNDIIETFDTLMDEGWFEDGKIEILSEVLKFTHLVKKRETHTQIIQHLIDFIQENKEPIFDQSSMYMQEDIDNILMKLEKYVLEHTICDAGDKNGVKIKI